MAFETIEVARIRIRKDARPVDQQHVQGLANSINSKGRMLEPIVVREVGDSFEVIAGVHRFLAVSDNLKWGMIDCNVVELDDKHAELAMIDENILRKDLSPAWEAKLLRRKMDLHLELYPSTREKVAGGKARQGKASDTLSFARSTALLLGKDERTVQRILEIRKILSEKDLDCIAGTILDVKTVLADLIKLEPTERQAYIQKVVKGQEIDLRKMKPARATQAVQSYAPVASAQLNGDRSSTDKESVPSEQPSLSSEQVDDEADLETSAPEMSEADRGHHTGTVAGEDERDERGGGQAADPDMNPGANSPAQPYDGSAPAGGETDSGAAVPEPQPGPEGGVDRAESAGEMDSRAADVLHDAPPLRPSDDLPARCKNSYISFLKDALETASVDQPLYEECLANAKQGRFKEDIVSQSLSNLGRHIAKETIKAMRKSF